MEDFIAMREIVWTILLMKLFLFWVLLSLWWIWL